MNAPALQARGLRVARGEREVLQGLDLTLPAGRWTAVVGPNGAGKTTLLQALACLQPFRGQVMWQGEDASVLGARERARRLAWLGQGEGGGEDLRVRDLVMLGRLPHQAWLASPSAADRAAVQDALRQVDGLAWQDRAFGQLSGGERQRVLLARALAVQAPLMLMDEPLTHLDPPHQADWLATVRERVRAGDTVVTVLHELNMALQADAMVLMDQGQVLHQGDCADAATHRALERLFGQRIAVRSADGVWVALPTGSEAPRGA